MFPNCRKTTARKVPVPDSSLATLKWGTAKWSASQGPAPSMSNTMNCAAFLDTSDRAVSRSCSIGDIVRWAISGMVRSLPTSSGALNSLDTSKALGGSLAAPNNAWVLGSCMQRNVPYMKVCRERGLIARGPKPGPYSCHLSGHHPPDSRCHGTATETGPAEADRGSATP